MVFVFSSTVFGQKLFGSSTVVKRGHKGWQRLARQVCILFGVAGRLNERTFGASRATRAGAALKAGYCLKGRLNLTTIHTVFLIYYIKMA